MGNQKVSIIILNYNGLKFLKKCLPTIEKQSYLTIETIVVDNNSSDGSCDFVKSQTSVKLIANNENYGYSKANNIAAGRANGDFLLFLNNDTELFPDMIEKLVLNYQEMSILAPAQILFVNKGVDLFGAAGNGMDIFGYPYGNKNPKITKVFYVDGAAIFIKKEDFINIGMFDEELFLFEEDIDFSWRAQLMGYKIVQSWDSKFYHYSGGSALGGGFKNKIYETSYFRRYLNERNVIRNILKNYSFSFLVIILPSLLLIHLCEIIILIIIGNWKVAACYFRAYHWNIMNFKDTIIHRKKVQSVRIINDIKLINKIYFSYSKLIAFIRIGFPKFK